MSPDADLYLEKMSLEKYCANDQCELCRVDSFDELIERIKSGRLPGGACPHWPPAKLKAFTLALEAGDYLPAVPSIDTPRPAEPGLFEMNEPDAGSPLLITGNSEFTQAVLFAVLSRTLGPVRLMSIDTKGHTVDMAMVFKELSADAVAAAIGKESVKVEKSARVVLPGLAGSIANDLEAALGRGVEVGPVCAAELPLFMGEDWVPA